MRTLWIPALVPAIAMLAIPAAAQPRDDVAVDPRPGGAQDDDYYTDRDYDDGVYDDRIDDDRVYYSEEDRAAAPVVRSPAVVFAPPREVVQPQPPYPLASPPAVVFAPPREVVQSPPGAVRPLVTVERAPEAVAQASGAGYPPPPLSDYYEDGYAMAQDPGAAYPPPPPRDYDDGYPDGGYADDYAYADVELDDYRDRYAPPPVVTHSGPGRVTTTTSYSGGGYIADGYYFPPVTTTTIVVHNGCNC